MPAIALITHPDYDISVPQGHRFVGQKFSDLMQYLTVQTWFENFEVFQTKPVRISDLRAVHDAEYIANFAYNKLDIAAQR